MSAAAAVPAIRAPGRCDVRVVFAALMLAVLLAALDATIVATALPTITSELGGLGQLSWVVTGYLLASTISTPIYGKLGDLYGRKRIMQGAIVVFLVGSALCGASQSMGALIAFRTRCRASAAAGSWSSPRRSSATSSPLIPTRRQRARRTACRSGFDRRDVARARSVPTLPPWRRGRRRSSPSVAAGFRWRRAIRYWTSTPSG
jgi:hypothetical protein